jgi:hypothetical protein
MVAGGQLDVVLLQSGPDMLLVERNSIDHSGSQNINSFEAVHRGTFGRRVALSGPSCLEHIYTSLDLELDKMGIYDMENAYANCAVKCPASLPQINWDHPCVHLCSMGEGHAGMVAVGEKRKNSEEDDHQAKVHRQGSAILTESGRHDRDARRECKASVTRVYASFNALKTDEDVARNFQVILDAAKGKKQNLTMSFYVCIVVQFN